MLASWVTFQFDLTYKQAIIGGATILSGAVSAYGPFAGQYFLDFRNERMARHEMGKLHDLAKAFPNDPDIEEKARIARAIIADGWLSRLKKRRQRLIL